MTDVIPATLAASGRLKKDTDYIGTDGLRYCGKCKGAKQIAVTIKGNTIYPFVRCPCEQAEYDKEEEQQKALRRLERIEKARYKAFPSNTMHEFTLANDNMEEPMVTGAIKQYCDNFPDRLKKGKGLLFYGGFGTGKTFAACEVANLLIDKGYEVIFTSISAADARLRNEYNGQDYFNNLMSCDLLIIDDFGSERRSEYMIGQMCDIIDSREKTGRPIILTTNMTMQELKTQNDRDMARICERLFAICTPIEMNGKNRRHEKIKAEFAEDKKLLGI